MRKELFRKSDKKWKAIALMKKWISNTYSGS